MIVLGFDTATPATAVGLLLDDGRALEVSEDPPPGGRPGHATRLLAIAAQLLGQAALRWEDVSLVAVGVGPGSFTGLRIGVATARGLAQSLDVGLVGVGTLRALAHAAEQHAPPPAAACGPSGPSGSSGSSGGVLAVLDARRGEAFAAAYAGDREIEAPAALRPEILAELAASLHARGIDRAVGDGAVRFRQHLQGAAVDIPPDSSSLHRVSAASVCHLAVAMASEHPAVVGATAILPDYRRRPDAEIGRGASNP